ncbi:MAG: FAD-dependent oxidoreductase [Lutibacter sp.]|uniref:NAD(P)/FAD-dependent oxidoreductase n=1 Tax=Lutibacter sp. TaxID=1925666 RepID=UPI0017C9C442|nr:FAD-dependent oxidoreductase [Lutibacter sp.]MBT8317461.1 FAD-dependent oxidoreductase [Lutibacter sp.]NNJ58320.1 FAD-dependent oxidoreductase [Lutibacter sp.]
MSKKVLIIGGGIIGLCSAYYLRKEGHSVTVIDKSNMLDGASYGNAGMIVPSHIIPLAQPGMIKKGIKWILNPKSPFYVRPGFSYDLIDWLFKFYKNSNQKHVDNSMSHLKNLSFLSKELYQEFAKASKQFLYEEKGLLMLYQNEKVGEEEIKTAQIAKRFGIEIDFLDKEGIQNLEKNTVVNALGAVHYKTDAHLSPNLFMKFLKEELLKMNVEIQTNTEIIDFKSTKSTINEIMTNKGVIKADSFVVAAGSWSPKVLSKLDIKLSLLPGKGYSFDILKQLNSPSVPSILCDGKVAVTPLDSSIRFGGTLEITNTNDTQINLMRLGGIEDTINNFYPEFEFQTLENKKIWSGFRPCTPNGLPIIEKPNKFSNLIISTGHAMMGLSLAPATGKLVSELVSEAHTSIDISAFKMK